MFLSVKTFLLKRLFDYNTLVLNNYYEKDEILSFSLRYSLLTFRLDKVVLIGS